MTARKYKLGEKDPETGLYRIIALKSFSNVCKGDIGGFVSSKDNLSQDGNAWIYENAHIYGNARIFGNAQIFGNARIFKSIKNTKDYITIGPIGSRNDYVTFIKSNKSVYVSVGCFNDTLSKFVKAVKTTHDKNNFAKEYLAAVEFVKEYFKIQKTEEK